MAAKVPTKLGTKVRPLWKNITDDYDLRPDELRILEDACREVDFETGLRRQRRRGWVLLAVGATASGNRQHEVYQ